MGNQRRDFPGAFGRGKLVSVATQHQHRTTRGAQVQPGVRTGHDGAVLPNQLRGARLHDKSHITFGERRVARAARMKSQRHVGTQ